MLRTALAVYLSLLALTSSALFAQEKEIVIQPMPNTFTFSTHFDVRPRYGGVGGSNGFDVSGTGDPIHVENVRESTMRFAQSLQNEYLITLERAHARGYSVDERLYVCPPVVPYCAPMPARCAYDCRPDHCRCGGLNGSCRCSH